jgi:hypothetical protein
MAAISKFSVAFVAALLTAIRIGFRRGKITWGNDSQSPGENMATVDEVLTAALGLPELQRAEVAVQHFENLPDPPDAPQDDEQLAALIRERQQIVEQGNFVAYDWRETIAHLDRAPVTRIASPEWNSYK